MLPKKYIKKYGISKKAWAEYKKSKKSPSKRRASKKTTKTKTRRKQNMNFNFGGGLGKGIAVGVAAGVINRFIPVNIAGADLIIAGMVMKDQTVQKIGAITLGRNLASGFVGGMTGNPPSGGGSY